MFEEFDEAEDPVAWPPRVASAKDTKAGLPQRVPRLVARLYASANGPLRAQLVTCLLRPLGSLGLVAVASGAFAKYLQRDGESLRLAAEDVARHSSGQISDLAQFVEQVSPEALQQLATVMMDPNVGLAAFSAATALVLMRTLRGLSDTARLRSVSPKGTDERQGGYPIALDEPVVRRSAGSRGSEEPAGTRPRP